VPLRDHLNTTLSGGGIPPARSRRPGRRVREELLPRVHKRGDDPRDLVREQEQEEPAGGRRGSGDGGRGGGGGDDGSGVASGRWPAAAAPGAGGGAAGSAADGAPPAPAAPAAGDGLPVLPPVPQPVVFFCDFHGHSRRRNVFTFGCHELVPSGRVPVPGDVPAESGGGGLGSGGAAVAAAGGPAAGPAPRAFPKLLASRVDTFAYGDCSWRVQRDKAHCARVAMWRDALLPAAYTIEASFAGPDAGSRKGVHFSTRQYEEVGYAFVAALLDYLEGPVGARLGQAMAAAKRDAAAAAGPAGAAGAAGAGGAAGVAAAAAAAGRADEDGGGAAAPGAAKSAAAAVAAARRKFGARPKPAAAADAEIIIYGAK
jgi:hypothetical protein